jgi:hypothetical protein
MAWCQRIRIRNASRCRLVYSLSCGPSVLCEVINDPMFTKHLRGLGPGAGQAHGWLYPGLVA